MLTYEVGRLGLLRTAIRFGRSLVALRLHAIRYTIMCASTGSGRPSGPSVGSMIISRPT